MNAVAAINAEPAMGLLTDLRAMGLRVFTTDEGVIKVAPRDRVTPLLRNRIQALRDGLLVHLEAERNAGEHLQARVRAMGQRWGYSLEEIEEAQAEARGDHDGWARLCEADELGARRARQAGLSYPP